VFERAAEYGLSKQAAAELLHKIAAFEEQALGLGTGGGVEPGFGLGNVTSLPGSDFADKMRPFERYSKENGGMNNRFLDYIGGAFGGKGGVKMDNVITPEYLRQQVLGEKQLPSVFNLNNPDPNATLMDKIQRFISQHKTGLGMGALGLGAAGLGAGAYALANRKNKEKKGSFDEMPLSLGEGLPEDPTMLGPAVDLGNVTSLPGSDFEDKMRGFERYSKEHGGANNPFNYVSDLLGGGKRNVTLDNVVNDDYLRDQVLGEKQLPSHFNLNNPDPNESLADKVRRFIKAHKTGLGMGAAGVGAAGLGAGAAYGLSRGKDKKK
jgi:hypothetical protein